MKKKGSILIEVIASLAMLSLIVTFAVSTHIHNNNVLKERQLSEEVDRAVYNLMNEIKYNFSIDEVKELLRYKEIGLKFDHDFSKQFLYKHVNDFIKGDDIKISLVEEKNSEIIILINTFIKKENYEVNIDKTFSKCWWMENVGNV
ncbi:hypothetical protein [Clostridium uliginosum]|uniref:Prepilin-type N-terminal cleavage/methylation domain-containing protein n=1 Tax=Clostridium uliginosum TaxID=119641 RepID=A0A1I1NFY4_9CLOT|nr:hypothetical protein [Clostridium uliginosum]SFC96395.1 hypothetical protein SAMN05421842_11531 [Clostridium uliginosum]